MLFEGASRQGEILHFAPASTMMQVGLQGSTQKEKVEQTAEPGRSVPSDEAEREREIHGEPS